MSEHGSVTQSTSVSPAERPEAGHCGLAALDEDARREYWSTLALRCTPGLGPGSVAALLHHFGSAWEAVQAPHDWDEAGVSAQRKQTFLSEAWRKDARPEWEAARRFQGQIILWTDERYPQRLKMLDDAPALLYVRGDASLLDAPSVAIVGSRNASDAAMAFAASVSEGLSAAGIAVVSGMAFGIDACAHRAALRGTGRTVAVLAGGADVPYPASHTGLYAKIVEQGLVVSECCPGAPVHKTAFPRRNRIVSGLSLGVVMVEAGSLRSGSLITARLAAEQGRPVYVPSPDALRGPYPEGTRSLLMQGAQPVWRAGDVMADLFSHLTHALRAMDRKSAAPAVPSVSQNEAAVPTKPFSLREKAVPVSAPKEPARSAPVPTPPALGPEEGALYALLKETPLTPDDLLAAVQEKEPAWTAPRLLSTLMIMEVKRLVRRRSDSRYEVSL